jgi:hypothetical protein
MSRTIEIDKAIDAALDASVSHITIGYISDREDGTLLQAFQQRLTEIKRMSPDLTCNADSFESAKILLSN